MKQSHQYFMEIALNYARLAASLGEVPVGALVVSDGQIVGAGYNRRELLNSCLEHAEMSAVREASVSLGRWRLTGCVVYSTLEPCAMCAGALVHARIDHLVYGAHDAKFGAIESLFNMASDPRLNHRFTYDFGVLADESSQLLKKFFKKLRRLKASDSHPTPLS